MDPTQCARVVLRIAQLSIKKLHHLQLALSTEGSEPCHPATHLPIISQHPILEVIISIFLHNSRALPLSNAFYQPLLRREQPGSAQLPTRRHEGQKKQSYSIISVGHPLTFVGHRMVLLKKLDISSDLFPTSVTGSVNPPGCTLLVGGRAVLLWSPVRTCADTRGGLLMGFSSLAS